MPAEFADTNVLLYLVSPDAARQRRAEFVLASHPAISVQVLNEIINTMRGKFKASWPQTEELLARVQVFCTVGALTIDMHERGVALLQRYRFSTYDAMIVAAALEAGCTTLWSEDMQHGLHVEHRLTIRNPFLSQGASA